MIRFQCPRCGKSFETGDTYAGTTFDCAGCNKRFVVPKQAGTKPKAKLSKTPTNSDDSKPSKKERTSQPKPKQKPTNKKDSEDDEPHDPHQNSGWRPDLTGNTNRHHERDTSSRTRPKKRKNQQRAGGASEESVIVESGVIALSLLVLIIPTLLGLVRPPKAMDCSAVTVLFGIIAWVVITVWMVFVFEARPDEKPLWVMGGGMLGASLSVWVSGLWNLRRYWRFYVMFLICILCVASGFLLRDVSLKYEATLRPATTARGWVI